MQSGCDAKYLKLSKENTFDWIHFLVESSSPNAISGISKFRWSQKIVLAQKRKPVITRCQVHLTLMKGKASNKEINIIVKFVLVIWFEFLQLPTTKAWGGEWEKIKKVIHSLDKTRRLEKTNQNKAKNPTEKNPNQSYLNFKLKALLFLSMEGVHGKIKYNWTKCRPFQKEIFYPSV